MDGNVYPKWISVNSVGSRWKDSAWFGLPEQLEWKLQ
jgi:hypothetical protein